MKAAIAVLALLPFAAPLSEAQQVIVEYEGRVESVEASPSWDFKVGDSVKGVVRLYPLLAPPDRRPADWWGSYVTGGPTTDFVVSDFVTGNRDEDAVHTLVGSLGQEDRYTLSDIGSIEGGPPESFRNFTIGVTGKGLLRGDGIAQSFEAIPKKDGSSIISALMHGVGEVRRTVTFALSRVSMTSGMCRP
jgi:hypothetical protein